MSEGLAVYDWQPSMLCFYKKFCGFYQTAFIYDLGITNLIFLK